MIMFHRGRSIDIRYARSIPNNVKDYLSILLIDQQADILIADRTTHSLDERIHDS